jgi:hypothetical protein
MVGTTGINGVITSPAEVYTRFIRY